MSGGVLGDGLVMIGIYGIRMRWMGWIRRGTHAMEEGLVLWY